METGVLSLVPETTVPPAEADKVPASTTLEALQLGIDIGAVVMGSGICPHPNTCVFSGCTGACK